MMTQAIQLLETFGSEKEAADCAAALEAQCGVTHVRVLKPTAAKPGWRVQAIMETNGEALGSWLPDGMRHVLVNDSVLASFRRVAPRVSFATLALLITDAGCVARLKGWESVTIGRNPLGYVGLSNSSAEYRAARRQDEVA